MIFDIVEVRKKNSRILNKSKKTIEGSISYSIKSGQSFNWEIEASIFSEVFSIVLLIRGIAPNCREIICLALSYSRKLLLIRYYNQQIRKKMCYVS